MENDRTTAAPKKKTVFDNDELDDVVIAADDTGMLASEKLITEAEIEEAEHKGDV